MMPTATLGKGQEPLQGARCPLDRSGLVRPTSIYEPLQAPLTQWTVNPIGDVGIVTPPRAPIALGPTHRSHIRV